MKLFRIFALCALSALPACAQTTNAPRLPSSIVITDTNALEFIDRAGISNSYDKLRISRLVTDLKAADLWDKFDAIYPFAGGTSNSCAQNLVSTNWPITWHGSPAFLSTGVRGDKSTAWGDTGYYQTNRAALTNEFHIYASVDIPAQQNAQGPIIANSESASWGGIGLTYSGPANQLVAFDPSFNGGGTALTGRGNAIAIRSGTNTLMMGIGSQGHTLINTNQIASLETPTNSVRLLGNMPSSGATSLQGYALATVHAASFGTSMTQDEVKTYFAIMNRYARYALVPSSSSSQPTSDAPGLPSSVTSQPTTNAPQIP